MTLLDVTLLAALLLGSLATSASSCAEAYASHPYFVDAGTRWTHFRDAVLAVDDAGEEPRILFRTSARRWRFAGPEVLEAARAAAGGGEVHVTVDERARVVRIDAEEPHPSCR